MTKIYVGVFCEEEEEEQRLFAREQKYEKYEQRIQSRDR